MTTGLELIFATNNRHKLDEVSYILGDKFVLGTLRDNGITEDIPEDRDTLEGNALEKARYVYNLTGKDCFADDTGLLVDALGGEPGVRSARYAGDNHDSAANMNLLLRNMEGKTDRRAHFRTVIALIIKGEEYLFEGIVDGTITDSPQGANGFGYDPIFVPEGYSQTFAELGDQIKNSISHRARAVEKFVNFLRRYNAKL